jgi:hypothetical protein
MYCLNICEVKCVLLFFAAISQRPMKLQFGRFSHSLLYPCCPFFPIQQHHRKIGQTNADTVNGGRAA